MPNKRTYYAIQQVGFAKLGENTFTAAHGVQTLGVNTTFNLEQVFELGQLAIYENIENIPDVEVSMEKVLDGYPLLGHLATNGASAATLTGRSNVRTTVGLSIFSDEYESTSGTPDSQMTASGMYLSQWGFNFQVQGNSTETISLVGNNKVWTNSFTTTTFDNTDSPNAAEGVNRREDVLFGSAGCKLPQDIDGISSSGTNELSGQSYAASIQSIRTSVNLGREALFELGRRGPFHRYVTFPVEVRTDFEVLTKAGDKVEALEEAENLTDRTITLKTQEGTTVALGDNNKLASTNHSGGDAAAGGSNVNVTYSYITYNDFTVTHPQDPSGL